jgi:nicotinate-nucleotide adenylyltransferase
VFDFLFDFPSSPPYPILPMLSIALFGTSADPPTAGHQAIIAWLADRYDQVAVWASDNPFKSHQTPLEHRSTMLQLLINDIEPPRQNVRLYPELSDPRALKTVERAQRIWANGELTLVIGSDLIEQLPRWYQVETLLSQVNLLVMPRWGYQIAEAAVEPLRQMGASVAIADVMVPGVSSTEYRQAGKSEVVTPPVEAYIHRQHLYS